MPLAWVVRYVRERLTMRDLDRRARAEYPQHQMSGGGDANARHGSNTRKELDSGRDA